MAAAKKSRARKCKGRHRRANRDTAHMRWLGAGAVAVGLGAAMATGQGVAAADTGSDADASSSASSSDAAGPSSKADAAESDSASSAGSATSDSTTSKPDKPSATVSASTVQSSKADEDSEDSTNSDTDTESPDSAATSPSSPPDEDTDASDAQIDEPTAPESEGSADESETELPAPPLVDTGESSEPDVVDPPSDADPVDTPDVPDVAMPELSDSGSDSATTKAAPSATHTPTSATAATQVVSDTTAGSDVEPDARVALQVAPALSASTQSAPVAMVAAVTAAEPVQTPAFLQGPITVRNVVTDVLTWLGLGQLKANLPVEPAPLPPPIEALWLAVRRFQYTFNNAVPTARPTISGQDAVTGVVTGKLNATDYDDDHLTYTVTEGPADGTVSVDAAGNFTYTPSAELAASGGQDEFTVTIDDRPGNPPHIHGLLDAVGLVPATTATVQVTVTAVNHLPAVTVTRAGEPDPATGAIGYQIAATDPDPRDNPVIAITDTPDHGTLVANGAGSYTYTPDRAYAHAIGAGGPTTDSFTVTADDGRGGLATHTENVVVSFVNAAPTVSATVGDPNVATGAIAGSVSGADIDGDPLSFTATSASAKGTVVFDTATRTYVYTPTEAARIAAAAVGAPAAAKQDIITVTASDGYTETDIDITVAITPPQNTVIATIAVGDSTSRGGGQPRRPPRLRHQRPRHRVGDRHRHQHRHRHHPVGELPTAWRSARTAPAPTSPTASTTPCR